jgi:hypothetical protein
MWRDRRRRWKINELKGMENGKKRKKIYTIKELLGKLKKYNRKTNL